MKIIVMLRQPSSRNQRARGFKLKHALQIGIFVAVCIWLIYQVKHSHEKKRAYDARNSKIISKSVENQEDFFKFRRKDLTSIEGAGTASKEEKSKEAQEGEEEPETKQDETQDEEMRGAADEVTDEQNQENVDEETRRGEDSTEGEGKEGQMEESDLFDSQDHEQGTQAREENYKSDDASSAVGHEQIVDGSKGDNSSTIYGSKIDVGGDDTEKKEMWAETVLNGTVDGSEVDNGTIDGSANNLSDDVKDNSIMPIFSLANNGNAAERKESEAEVSKPGNALLTNTTIVEEKVRADLTNATTTADELNNHTELSVDSTASVSENQTEGQNDSTVVELPAEVQNTTVEAVSNLENEVDRAKNSNSSAVLDSEEQSTASSATTNGTGDAGMGEAIHDLWHAVTDEERDNRTDLSTLPGDIRNEARTMEDDAAE